MGVWNVEQAIFTLEEVRVVIRAPSDTRLGRYRYERAAACNTRLSEWLRTRVYPITGNHEVVVVDGSGAIPHGSTRMDNLRSTYER